MSLVDRSAEVRRGEKLNAVVLQAYLRDIVPEVHDGLEIKQFPGGFSNLTYLLQAGERELVLRRPPHGTNVAGAHDMGREYRVISGLQHTYGRVPAPVHYCADATVIGAPFYLMERLRGVILRAHPPRDANLDPDIMRRLSAAFISNLAELHDIDPAATGLTDLGRPKGY
ncbi:MAG: phosphotransferase family protein, partial [Gammaproteobacteria bacterium]|nr:phosphotransferase family protein [Gammaproteobacteria bacterium]